MLANGTHHSKEHKQYLSRLLKGRTKSKETKKKISISKIGKIIVFDNQEKIVVCISKETFELNKNRYFGVNSKIYKNWKELSSPML